MIAVSLFEFVCSHAEVLSCHLVVCGSYFGFVNDTLSHTVSNDRTCESRQLLCLTGF